jgi:tyrosyl-tRNA synthetase
VFDYYQFWVNTGDETVESLLKVYTEIPLDEVVEIMKLHTKDPAARGAQKALALAATEILHGRSNAVNAAHITKVLFGQTDVSALPTDGLELLSATIPTVVKNTTVVEALVKTGLAASKGEALRLIKGRGISLNGRKIEADQKIAKLSLIKKGKNSFVLVK